MSKLGSKFESRLGRGVESVLGPRSFSAAGRSVVSIPLSDIELNPYQPRKVFDEEAIEVLAHSIRVNGLAQPILVRPTNGNKYELVAGERRLRACAKCGFDRIPSISKSMSDKQSLQIALVENLDRENLNPIEEAEGYRRLIDEFGYSHQTLAELFKKSRSSVSNVLRLLHLPKSAKDALLRDSISYGHARALLSLPDIESIELALGKILSNGLSVRDVETMTFDLNEQIAKDSDSGMRAGKRPRQFKTYVSEFKSLGYKANLTGSQQSGKLNISYSSQDQLRDLLRRFNVDLIEDSPTLFD